MEGPTPYGPFLFLFWGKVGADLSHLDVDNSYGHLLCASLGSDGHRSKITASSGQVSSDVVVIQLLSYVQLFVPTPRLPCPSLSRIVCSNSFMSIESVMPSHHLILCRPLLLPSVFPSIKVFSSESAFHIRWPKY